MHNDKYYTYTFLFFVSFSVLGRSIVRIDPLYLYDEEVADVAVSPFGLATFFVPPKVSKTLFLRAFYFQ